MELVLVQLTDIHIKDEFDLQKLLPRIESLVGAISEVIIKPEETTLLIAVTGDVAYSGNAEQYNMAEQFFDSILDKLQHRWENNVEVHLVFVPGNHDCDFNDPMNTAREALIQGCDADFMDAGTMGICTSVQKNFFEFVQRYVDKGLSLPLNKNGVFTENTISNNSKECFKNYKIKLHCLNTSWCSHLIEQREMKFILPEGIPERDDNDIVITLMHHGKEWFDWCGERIWQEYHQKYSDVILVGHDHSFSYECTTNYDETTDYYIRGEQLFSSELPEQSGFNIYKLCLEDKIEMFYSFVWENGIYSRCFASSPKTFVKTKFSNKVIRLKEDAYNDLEAIEIDILSKYKNPLLLSDIYVFPVMQGSISAKSEYKKTFRKKEDILKIIDEKKKIVVTGRKESGKTSFLKQLFLEYYHNKLYPVILHGEDIKSADEAEVNKLVRGSYDSIYKGINLDQVMQAEPAIRACLIDDFDNNYLSDKSLKKLIEYIVVQFGTVIIVRNNTDNMMTSIKKLESNDYIETEFYELEICELKRYMKNQILNKWLLLEDSSQDVNSQEFDIKRKQKKSQIESVIRTGFFSNTPLEYLLVLSYIDNSSVMSTDYSRYSYIYDCLIRDKINEIANKDTIMCTAYNTLLELLAYILYQNKVKKFFDEKFLFEAIAQHNEEYAPFPMTSIKIIEKLVDGKILEERNNQYKFKHDYMYYYFVGSYIRDVLPHEERKQKLEEIISDLSQELNYNIALFLAYCLNAEYDILPIVDSICANLLSDFKDFNYEDQQVLLSKLKTTIVEKIDVMVPENSAIPKIQEQRQIEEDELEELENIELTPDETEETKKRAEENFEAIFNNFTKLLRLIQYEGDIIKNYSTKIRKAPRHEMISLMGKSNLKLIGFLCEMFSTEIDKIIELVEKKVKSESEKQEITKRAFIDLIQEYVGVIWSQFIEINVANLAYCLDCELIKNDLLWYKSELPSEFSTMVYIEYCMRTASSRIPVDEIQQCVDGKGKLSNFSQIILRRMVAKYLVNYQYDESDKSRVCKLLGFDYKKIYIEEQRNAYIDKKEN